MFVHALALPGFWTIFQLRTRIRWKVQVVSLWDENRVYFRIPPILLPPLITIMMMMACVWDKKSGKSHQDWARCSMCIEHNESVIYGRSETNGKSVPKTKNGLWLTADINGMWKDEMKMIWRRELEKMLQSDWKGDRHWISAFFQSCKISTLNLLALRGKGSRWGNWDNEILGKKRVIVFLNKMNPFLLLRMLENELIVIIHNIFTVLTKSIALWLSCYCIIRVTVIYKQ